MMLGLGLGTSQTRLSLTLSLPYKNNNNNNNKWGNAKANPKTKALSIMMTASPTNSNYPLASRIMVRNLGYSISESSLQKEFSSFGQVAEVKLVKDETLKRWNAYALIQYTCQDDAILALENMDGKIFDGRLIYVELAKPRKNSVRQYPIASGPPKKQHLQHQDEVADCWY